jgi:1-aminocyclopropane-1-carboxylate deaminase/D-cysteine desulfhydrase-like pyridoxal-dependent ACC family enzyme
MRLGRYPTPVDRLDEHLWIKRDDRSAEPYGGNKVRKLERFFEDARAAGKRRILTLGAAGSHQVLATAIYGVAAGFAVEAVLVPQPSTSHARVNLAVALGHGLVAHAAPAWALAPPVVAAHLGRDVYFIPLGGSNVTGSLGYVDAARELAVQIRDGALPEPDVAVVALGSGGTAAGLAAGLEEAGLRTRVIGVAISHPARVLAVMSHRLACDLAKAIGVHPARAASRLEVDRRWVGRGYCYFTRDAQEAIADATKLGVELDPTYTAKAFAAALSRARAGTERVLFWHTLSTHPLDPLPRQELPPNLARLLR